MEILVEMIVRLRTATGRSDLRPKGDSSSSLRTGKMDDNFFAKRMQRVALATSEDDGKRLRDHLYEIAANSES